MYLFKKECLSVYSSVFLSLSPDQWIKNQIKGFFSFHYYKKNIYYIIE